MLTIIDAIKRKAASLTPVEASNIVDGKLLGLLTNEINDILDIATQSHTGLFLFIDDYAANTSTISQAIATWEGGDESAVEDLKTIITAVKEKLQTAENTIWKAKDEMEVYIKRLVNGRAGTHFEITRAETSIELLDERLEDNRKEMERYKLDEQADLWGPVQLLERERDIRIDRQNDLLRLKSKLEKEKLEKEMELAENDLWRRRAEAFRASTETLQDIVENLIVGLGFTQRYFDFLIQTLERDHQESILQINGVLPLIDRNIKTFRKAVIVNPEEVAGG